VVALEKAARCDHCANISCIRDFRRRDSATTGASVNTFVCGTAGKILAGRSFSRVRSGATGRVKWELLSTVCPMTKVPRNWTFSCKNALSLSLSLYRIVNSDITILIPNNPFTTSHCRGAIPIRQCIFIGSHSAPSRTRIDK